MGPKLSRAPADHVVNRRHQATVTSHASEKTHQCVMTGGQASSTAAGAPTTHSANAGLLAALRWKKLTRQRRGKRALVDRSDKTTCHQQPQPPQPALPTGSSNTGLWNKVIRHLSRKMDVGRHQRQRAGWSNANDHTDGQRLVASKSTTTRAGGTSSVLPVARNPVTSVIAYADNVGGDHPQHEKTLVDVNSNVADIVRRITISTRCQVRCDVTGVDVPQLPVTSSSVQCSAVETQPTQKLGSRKTIQIQASTGELLTGFSEFLRCRCRRLRHFDGSEVASWLRSVDRSLIEHAWQDTAFLGPANIVLVYLLAFDAVDPDIVTTGELQAIVMACLYVAFSYAGSEISYPLKPFISAAGVDEVTSHSISGAPGKKRFWNRCLAIIERSSGEMLRLNREPAFFAELFRDLKAYASTSTSVTSHATSVQRSRDVSQVPSSGVVSTFTAPKVCYHGNEE